MGASVDQRDPHPGAVGLQSGAGAPAGERATWRARARRWVRRHATTLLLLGTLGVGATVRLVNLNVYGFNSDEAVYAGQAAALAGNPHYVGAFPVFRAHPMLIQSLLSVFFRSGEHDVVGRVVIAAIGVLTLYVVHRLGVELYSRRVGVLAAAIMALMPYHVMVTRQVLLDGPMVLFSTLTLLLVAKFAKTGRLSWMLAAGAALGLTMLSKESSIVLVGAVYASFALTPAVRRPIIGSVMGFSVALALFALHPISVALSGHVSTTKAYLIWQLVRRPNHGYGFYMQTVPGAVGVLVLLSATLAVWLVWRRRQPAWREVLLLSWIVVPTLAFTVWPVKGFQYLLPAAPALAVLAARGLAQVPLRLPRRVRERLPRTAAFAAPRLRGVAVAAVLGSLAVSTFQVISPHASATGLAGTGGIPGGREAGRWVGAHTPRGAVLMTLGPSMANILEFYGHRDAYGLSVSPNPLHRNPSYTPIPNPDYALRHGDLQYVVWDKWSANRSDHFSRTLLGLARRFHGRLVHTESAVVDGVKTPVIKIYEVRP
ncbi:MAG: ArnT family glycosyltransferase [Nocardioides sp.]